MMDKGIKYVRSFTVLLLFVMFVVSCVKRPLECRGSYGHVELILDWSRVDEPASVVKCLFYNESGVVVREVISSTSSIVCQLPTGRYNIVVHSMDASRVEFRGMGVYSSAEAYTPEIGRSLISSLIGQPEFLHGAGRCREFEVLSVDVKRRVKGVVEMLQLTKDVKLRFILNGADTESIEGYLTGVSPSVFLASSRYAPSRCRVDFATKRDATKGFFATIRIFDLSSKSDPEAMGNLLEVKVVENGGKEYQGVFDLTDVLKRIIDNNGGDLPISIPIDIELSVSEVGDLKAFVKPWIEGTGSGDINTK